MTGDETFADTHHEADQHAERTAISGLERFEASGCAGFLTGQYLLDPSGASGIDGTVCPPEFNPFDIGTAEPEAAPDGGLAPAMRTKLMEQIGYRPRS